MVKLAMEDDCRSRKGAWIEIVIPIIARSKEKGRSRKGAWIEISMVMNKSILQAVAPVRERGLKLDTFDAMTGNKSRSRKGAWIEIKVGDLNKL